MARADPFESIQALFHAVPLVLRRRPEDQAILLQLTNGLRSQWHFDFVGIEPSERMRSIVCLQAALPVLRLGLSPYRHVHGVVIANQSVRDLGGFYDGAVHLNWPFAQHGLEVVDDGSNVILHEFAHALDVERRIVATGRLPPSVVDARTFVVEFMNAFARANVRRQELDLVVVTDHALFSPAEFFAFVVEFFFEAPAELELEFPDVYRQLCALFGQDPLVEEIDPP